MDLEGSSERVRGDLPCRRREITGIFTALLSLINTICDLAEGKKVPALLINIKTITLSPIVIDPSVYAVSSIRALCLM
jgi:hypothetical protein